MSNFAMNGVAAGAAAGAAVASLARSDPPVARAASPADAGATLRHNAEMATLQRDNFPAYVEQMSATLAPEDRQNPFAYSLGHDVPIEVKRQVFAEYQSGQEAPRVEVTRMAGNNATYSEREGRNGTIRINADLIGDTSRPGQMEAFAVWGHMEEVGHWADARAHTLMGQPGGDATGDEGARYALLASGSVVDSARPGSMVASYDIPVTGGRPQTVQVDTVVLRALGAEKVANGSFARENRVGDVESFGPEGHYQTTFITAMAAGTALGMPDAEIDMMANRLALGSQLPDMLSRFDAASQWTAKRTDQLLDGAVGSPFKPSFWTPAEQRHLESVYEGLHALPRHENSTTTWQSSEKQETAAFIQQRIAAGDYVTAGVAIHRYGDLHAHVRDNGLPYSGDNGHLSGGHAPDYLYRQDGLFGRAESWSKPIDYQSSLSTVVAAGLADRMRASGDTVSAREQANATDAARTTWRSVYDSSLAASRAQENWGPDGANAHDATETWFRNSAAAVIQEFHREAGGRFAPLSVPQMGVEGNYPASSSDVRSLNTVKDRFDAQ